MTTARGRNSGDGKDSIMDIEDVKSPVPFLSSASPSPVKCKVKSLMAVLSKAGGKKRCMQPSEPPMLPKIHPNKILSKKKASLLAAKSTSRPLNVSVENFSSNLTSAEVEQLLISANISSSDYEYLIPSKNQRANEPPKGYLTVYTEQVDAGLRFPLHDLVIRVCNCIKISPSQLVPNAHRMMVGFILCAKFYDIPITVDTFFSLFSVYLAPLPGLFQFSQRAGTVFLEVICTSFGPWKRKFFFLRRTYEGKSWNCLTKWQETFLKHPFSPTMTKSIVKSGILNHRFRVDMLSDKMLLVHGCIQRGVPSREITFRYLMHRAAVTKFKLLPEDMPQVHVSFDAAKKPTSKSSLSLFSSPIGVPSAEVSSASSEEDISTSEILIHDQGKREIRKRKFNRAVKSSEAHRERNSTVPMMDEVQSGSSATHLLTISKILESAYVPKETFQKLEAELDLMKTRVKELEQKLEHCERERADPGSWTLMALEAVNAIELMVENLQSDTVGRCDKIRKEAVRAIQSLMKENNS